MKKYLFLILFFSICSLQGMFDGSSLNKANLKRTVCIGTSFKKASMIEINMANADVRGADFEGADLTNADLSNAKISTTGIPLTDGKFLPPTNFKGAKIDGINLSGQDEFTKVYVRIQAGEQ